MFFGEDVKFHRFEISKYHFPEKERTPNKTTVRFRYTNSLLEIFVSSVTQTQEQADPRARKYQFSQNVLPTE